MGNASSVHPGDPFPIRDVASIYRCLAVLVLWGLTADFERRASRGVLWHRSRRVRLAISEGMSQMDINWEPSTVPGVRLPVALDDDQDAHQVGFDAPGRPRAIRQHLDHRRWCRSASRSHSPLISRISRLFSSTADATDATDATGLISVMSTRVAHRRKDAQAPEEPGRAAYVRFDHGPEFIAYVVSDWCRFNGTDTVFIDPGSRWQNAWIESFNGRLCDEFLNGQQTLFEARSSWRAGESITTCTDRTAPTAGSPVGFVEAWFNQQQRVLA